MEVKEEQQREAERLAKEEEKERKARELKKAKEKKALANKERARKAAAAALVRAKKKTTKGSAKPRPAKGDDEGAFEEALGDTKQQKALTKVLRLIQDGKDKVILRKDWPQEQNRKKSPVAVECAMEAQHKCLNPKPADIGMSF